MARSPAKRDILVLCQQMGCRRIRLLMALHVVLLHCLILIRKRQIRLIREPCRFDPEGRSKNFNDIIYESEASEFSNIFKALSSLVQVEAANAEAMNALQSAFTHELEAQKQTAERREQLFAMLTKLTEFTSDQIVKAALIIGQNDEMLNLFFTTPDEFKSEFVRQVLEKI